MADEEPTNNDVPEIPEEPDPQEVAETQLILRIIRYYRRQLRRAETQLAQGQRFGEYDIERLHLWNRVVGTILDRAVEDMEDDELCCELPELPL